MKIHILMVITTKKILSEDIIRIYLSEYDRTDKEDYSKILQTWKGLILHETIHEYQHKIHPEVIKKDKQIIDDLLDERKKQELTVIRDNDHDLVFYQSLFEVSKILNHNLERLIDQIV